MTKLFYFLCGLVAFIALWAIFGSNPMYYILRKNQEHMTKTLVTRIMKHNDPDYVKKLKRPPTRNSGLDMGGDTSADKEGVDTSDVMIPSKNGLLGPGPANRGGIMGTLGSSNTPRKNIPRDTRRGTLQSEPEMTTPPQQNPEVPADPSGQPSAQPLEAPAGDGYYPPSPSDANKPKPQSVLQPLFHRKDGIPLMDGTLVKFAGTKVFTVGPDGMEKPLKDGEYPISDGKFVIRIRAGERFIYQ